MIDFASSGDRKRKSLNRCCYGSGGVVGSALSSLSCKWKGLERPAIEGDSPVHVRYLENSRHLSRAGHEEPCLNPRGPSRKAKYYQKTDSEPVL